MILAIVVFTNVNANAQNPEERIYNMLDEVSTEKLSEHIKKLADAGGTRSRITFTRGVDSAAVYIKKVFDSFSGLTSVELDTFYIATATSPYNNQPQVNVVATIEGSTNPEKIFVIGAHLDATANNDSNWGKNGANWKSIEAPGADDNATGIASILELARLMSDEQFNFANDFTIKLVAFGAEEYGANYKYNHHGSTHFANQIKTAENEIIGMVSMDMIGFNDFNDYASIVKDEKYVGNESVTLGEKFVKANKDFSIGLITNKAPFETGTYSDHQSFSDVGIPAILLIENAPWKSNDYYNKNPYYHTTEDVFETINIELVKRITQLNLATLASYNGTATGVESEDVSTPDQLSLSQNYPNPFNPSTVIKYHLQESSHVTLKVFNMLGKEVSVLIDGNKASGSHEVVFDANSIGEELASGIYLYQLRTDRSVISNKMTLIK
tara:strand:+ start:995 stop:2314 length:1320 start_codon:yes stop_codon:yes gene_type:complete